MTEEAGGFFSRWSQRKQAVKQGVPLAEPLPKTPETRSELTKEPTSKQTSKQTNKQQIYILGFQNSLHPYSILTFNCSISAVLSNYNKNIFTDFSIFLLILKNLNLERHFFSF